MTDQNRLSQRDIYIPHYISLCERYFYTVNNALRQMETMTQNIYRIIEMSSQSSHTSFRGEQLRRPSNPFIDSSVFSNDFIQHTAHRGNAETSQTDTSYEPRDSSPPNEDIFNTFPNIYNGNTTAYGNNNNTNRRSNTFGRVDTTTQDTAYQHSTTSTTGTSARPNTGRQSNTIPRGPWRGLWRNPPQMLGRANRISRRSSPQITEYNPTTPVRTEYNQTMRQQPILGNRDLFSIYFGTLGNLNTFTNITDLFGRNNNTNNIGTDFFNPVTVRPTRREINNAIETRRFRDIETPHTLCPIGLQEFQENDVVARIHHCGHVFNLDNLLTWLRHSVRCPVCRYDIREYVAPTENTDESVDESINENTGENNVESSGEQPNETENETENENENQPNEEPSGMNENGSQTPINIPYSGDDMRILDYTITYIFDNIDASNNINIAINGENSSLETDEWNSN